MLDKICNVWIIGHLPIDAVRTEIYIFYDWDFSPLLYFIVWYYIRILLSSSLNIEAMLFGFVDFVSNFQTTVVIQSINIFILFSYLFSLFNLFFSFCFLTFQLIFSISEQIFFSHVCLGMNWNASSEEDKIAFCDSPMLLWSKCTVWILLYQIYYLITFKNINVIFYKKFWFTYKEMSYNFGAFLDRLRGLSVVWPHEFISSINIHKLHQQVIRDAATNKSLGKISRLFQVIRCFIAWSKYIFRIKTLLEYENFNRYS